jgi:hypothetical protein
MSESNFTEEIVWNGTASAWLYFYQYIFIFIVAVVLSYYFSWALFVGAIIMLLFVLDAKMMRYEVTDKRVSFSPSLFDREPNSVSLEDIKGFFIIDAKPWSYFSLGTLILIEDFTEEAHPCLKSIKNPQILMRMIKRLAKEQGAELG